MTDFSTALTAMQHYPNPIDIFAETLRPELVEEALSTTGTASIRRRKLPAEQVVWLMVGLALYGNRSIKDVFNTLGLEMNGKVVSSSVTDARKRLGPAPIEYLFRNLGAAWTQPHENFLLKGLSLFGIDGSVFNVSDSEENSDYFGRPGSKTGHSAYPQVRMVALMDLNSRIMRSAKVTPLKDSERAAASMLYRDLPHDSLCLMDRGFVSYRQFCAITDGLENKNFMCRVRSDNAPKFIKQLPDGSHIVEIRPTKQDDKIDATLPPELRVRRIEYQVEGTDGKIFLYTSLMDHGMFSAIELAQLYHKRWELEIAFDELKTEMLNRKEALRSNLPLGVEQEVWSMLLTYNLVRQQMAHVATEKGLPPSRMSFKYSMLAIEVFFLLQKNDESTGRLPEHLRKMREKIWEERLPPRRSERSNRRCVKIKMSGYPRKAPRARLMASNA